MTTVVSTRPAPAASTAAPPADRPPRSERRAGALLTAPFLVIYLLFLIGPLLVGVVLSFFNTTTVKSGLGDFVGLANYREVVTDSLFWDAMWHSVVFTLLTTPPLVILALVVAILAARMRRGRVFYRIAFFAPYVVPSSVVALIFLWMYTPQIGLLPKLFGAVGLPVPDFIGSTSGGWTAVTLMTLWWTFGFNFVLYTAAVQDVPPDVYEAAAIDGASPWQQIRHITVPLLGRTTSLVLILQILASLKVFDQIYLLLAGGPNQSTRPVIEYIYDTGFTSYRGGYGAAATMVYFVVIVAVSAAWYGLRRRRAGSTAV
ncbi:MULTISPECIES: carbohydrate ABC transporter permease [unclassified Streptomyces]|uniref:carbohydrate ABC transporter permease n=1 Tax=unclassified Streptomyces TaxID=2593676 RepID=UPI0013C7ACBD|nr:sugar ABC transporter permease [Streptomyces sp. SID8499]NED34590.1 sugar ABC transporter permease [Streptomyces sp. SID8499]NED74606.1 sugar ABC transporter permease [Streptomyces sp. SID9944]